MQLTGNRDRSLNRLISHPCLTVHTVVKDQGGAATWPPFQPDRDARRGAREASSTRQGLGDWCARGHGRQPTATKETEKKTLSVGVGLSPVRVQAGTAAGGRELSLLYTPVTPESSETPAKFILFKEKNHQDKPIAGDSSRLTVFRPSTSKCWKLGHPTHSVT